MAGSRKHTGGRRPKPTAQLKIQGTYRPDRHGRRAAEPLPLGDLAEPPPELTDSQQAIWSYAIQHSPTGLLKLVDKALLTIWCEAVDRHGVASSMLAKQNRSSPHPMLVKAPDGRGLVVSPYIRIIDAAAKLMIVAARELGFTPAARTGISIAATPGVAAQAGEDPDDVWGQLRIIPGGKSPDNGID